MDVSLSFLKKQSLAGAAGGAPSTDQRARELPGEPAPRTFPTHLRPHRELCSRQTDPGGNSPRLSEEGGGLASGQPAFAAQTPVP